MDNTASVDVMTYNYKKKKKHKIKKELEEEPTLLASAHLSPAESGQVSGHRTSLLFLLLSDSEHELIRKHLKIEREKKTMRIIKGSKL